MLDGYIKNKCDSHFVQLLFDVIHSLHKLWSQEVHVLSVELAKEQGEHYEEHLLLSK